MMFVGKIAVSQTTITISGNAKSYASDSLIISTEADYITNKKTEITKFKVDSLGNFKVQIQSRHAKQYSISLGIYDGIFYANPGDNLVMKFPKKQLPSKIDSLNPYFRPEQRYLKVIEANNENLTEEIMQFDLTFRTELERVLQNFRGRVNPLIIDSAVNRIEEKHPANSDGFFRKYKQYKYILLRHVAYKKSTRKFINNNFNTQPVEYFNPAYNEAMRVSLSYVLDASNLLRKSDAEKNIWGELNKQLEKKSQYSNKRFREYVLIMNLHRMAIKNVKKRKFYIELFKSIQSQTEYPMHKRICERIEAELQLIYNGKEAPDFSLKNAIEDTKTLQDYKGKFLYLGFISEESYTVKKELFLLEDLVKEDVPGLQVAMLYVGKDFEKFKEFAKKNKYSFDLLFVGKNSELLKKYRVLTFPQYYLISPAGKLTMISAPGPAKNFRSVYGSYYMEWKRNQMRKENKQGKPKGF